MPDPTKITPRTLWGRIVIYMREHFYRAMHVACGDITDVDFKSGVFIVRSEEQYLIDLLESEDNRQILKNAFLTQGVTEYKIEKKEKKEDIAKQDVEFLSKMFKDKFNIENE